MLKQKVKRVTGMYKTKYVNIIINIKHPMYCYNWI